MDGEIAGAYDLDGTLGKGRFAVVRSARHVFTGERVAVKVIDKTKLDQISRDHLYKEVNCLKLVRHPNIVRLYEVIDTLNKLYLILDLADGGDLYDVILKEGPLNEEDARKYFRQVLQAVEYCHKLHVVHRDLKPDNIVFFLEWPHVRLTDFGLSNIFRPGEKLSTSCGSMNYTAPEILIGDSYDGPAGDVWSLGVILYYLVVGQEPFNGANDSETAFRILDGEYKIPGSLSPHCSSIIKAMLQVNPQERPSASKLIHHPWLNGLADSTSALTPMVDREGLTPEEAGIITDKMVAGCIASQEEIQKSLNSGSYNHITATFYLLAESHFRRKRTGFSPAAHSHVLRKQSMPNAFASLALSPRGEYQMPLVIGQACIDSSIVRSAISPIDPFSRMRKISAAERGVLRPRSHTVQTSPIQKGREKTCRGGLDLPVSSSLSSSPVFKEECQQLPVYTSLQVGDSNKAKEDVKEGPVVCNGEGREHRVRKKTVKFAVDTNPPLPSETTVPTQLKQEEEKESPRRSGVVGPKGRRLVAARSSPSFSLNAVNDPVYSDDDEVNLLLSPDLKRRSPTWSSQRSPTWSSQRSPTWSSQRSPSPSCCFFQQHFSQSPAASPEQRNKWNGSPVFVRISREGSAQELRKEKSDDIMTAANAELQQVS